ncbi:MAG: DNA polymerase III subunit alpha [Bacteroidales bacterium]|nr:DNA polymerase III subunit alpha [Porphyromonas sp.]MDD6934084.1 DNA polymerase III subunit alpha [Bacteroidales bacterium]MDY3102492.1 DNA polymerase III subunit alpha [Porphyromonas sp.]
MEPFVHLHVHSQYSVLDGQASVSALVKKAVKDGMKGIALTDHGVMYGIKSFFDECAKQNGSSWKEIASIRKEVVALQTKKTPSSPEEEMRYEQLKQDLKKVDSEQVLDSLPLEINTLLVSAETEEERELINELSRRLEEAKNKLFKPILGCEAYCARRTRFDKDKNVPDPYKPKRPLDSSGWHLILLAKNKTGYLNLCKMVSASFVEGEYYRPRIDKDLLKQYHEGIIVLSACLGGEVPQHIMAGYPERAEETVRWFKEVFGDDYYLEVQLHQTDDPNANRETYTKQLSVNEVIYDIAERVGVKVIATNDVHFVNQEDAVAHDLLICVGTTKSPNDPNRMRYSRQEWLKTQEEMNEVFRDRPELLRNSLEVLNKVEYYSIENPALMPDFPLPDGFKDENDYLRYLSYEGAKKRYGDPIPDEVIERLDFELDTIKSMGFPGYFLIVQDFIQAARDMGVSVGPGRGSAAGSTVAYCLKITNLDPLKYGLLFERFLNPDRISLPDIDIDFDDLGRDKILEWVTEKYGERNVAHIITFGAMATKSAIADMARLEEVSIDKKNQITSLIPQKFSPGDIDRLHRIPGYEKDKGDVSLEKAILLLPELKKYQVDSDPRIRKVLKYAQQLEGNIRNTGVHACGVIISKYDISDVVPVCMVTEEKSKKADGKAKKILVTQYEGKLIESTGLIKMDFLGLRTLSIIQESLEIIEQRHHIRLNVDELPLDDPKTFELFSEGKTVAVFQFESAGMQKYLRELQPDRFELLIAMNALYRPGPMEYIPQYIARRHGREQISYDIPETKVYLEETYGITVYQEQVMLLSRLLAGFSRGDSDNLRKAMGKKQIDKMAALKTQFLEGAVERGHAKEVLEKIWADWEAFAKYAFNKSHAACYSLVAYQTAYLKAHYPSEFMAGNLSCNLNDAPEISKLMQECKAMGIQLLSPDVNESVSKFSVNSHGDIRFGLSAIKGVNKNTVDVIIEERTKNGQFADIFDFMRRIPGQMINKKTMEAFVLSGAFDCMGIARESYFAPPIKSIGTRDDNFISVLLSYGKMAQSETSSQSATLFDEVEDQDTLSIPNPLVPEAEPWGDLERLNKERDLVGLYISSNPLDPYRLILDKYCNVTLDLLHKPEDHLNRNLIFAGVITEVSEGLTKKNNPYARVTLEDLSGSYSFALFGKQYLEYKSLLQIGVFLLCNASVKPLSYKPEQLEVAFSKIQLLSDVLDTLIKEVRIQIYYELLDPNFISDLSKELKMRENESKDSSCKLIVSFLDLNDNQIMDYVMTVSTFSPGTWLVNLLERYEIPYSIK